MMKWQNKKSNTIPIVINKGGLIVYAIQSIGIIVKIVNGVPESSTNATTNIYKNSELKSTENTYINYLYIDDVPIV